METTIHVALEPLGGRRQSLRRVSQELHARVLLGLRFLPALTAYRRAIQYLTDTIDDLQLHENGVTFAFSNTDGHYDVSQVASRHWFELMLSTMDIDDLIEPYGYRLAEPLPDVERLLAEGPKFPLVVIDDRLCGITRVEHDGDQPRIFTDVAADAFVLANLSPEVQNVVMDIAQTGRCRCQTCNAYRAEYSHESPHFPTVVWTTKPLAMPDNPDFLKEVLADPDNDAPRLIYADWLAERGEPRGEFIRVQCHLSACDEDHPSYGQLRYRERQLSNEFKAQWLPTLDGKTRFDRGFIGFLRTTSFGFMNQGRMLLSQFPIQKIELSMPDAADAAKLAQSGLLGNIRHLGLVSIQGSETIGALLGSKDLSGLTSLQLSHGDLDRDNLRTIATSGNLSNLKRLKCDSADISDTRMAEFVRSSQTAQLHHLEFKNSLVGDTTVKALSKSRSAEKLQSLTISYGRITQSGVRAIAKSNRLAALRHLDLSYCGLAGRGATALAESSSLNELRSLSLAEVPPEGIRALASASGLGKLTSLTLHYRRADDGVLEALIELIQSPMVERLRSLSLHCYASVELAAAMAQGSFHNLQYLNLDEPSFGDQGVQLLAKAPWMTQVRELSLFNNRQGVLGNQAAIAIAESPHLRNLETLNVILNKIGDKGAAALAASPNLDRVAQLHLGGNSIGNRGARALLESPHLHRWTEFYIRSNGPIDDSLHKELRNRFATCWAGA